MENSPIEVIVTKLRAKTIDTVRTVGNAQEFKLLCEIAFAPMISRERWKLNHTDVDISTLLTVADEAFALLTMENNIQEWLMLLKYGKGAVKKGEHTRYTSQGENKDGTKKGWTLEGKKRFNYLYDSVTLECGRIISKELEETVRDEWKKEGGKLHRKGGVTETGDEEVRRKEEAEFVPRNGFLN